MVLNFSQPAYDADENFVGAHAQFFSELLSPLRPIAVDIQIDPQRNYGELSGSTDAKPLIDFAPLLFRDHDDSISREPREHSLNREKRPRLRRAVIAVKDVAVISMHQSTGTWPSDKN